MVARRARARDIVRLMHRSTGVHRLARDMTRALQRAVPFDGVSLLTVDPATLLPTHEVVGNVESLPEWSPDMLQRFIEIEFGEPDFNKFTVLARQGRRAASLSEATVV